MKKIIILALCLLTVKSFGGQIKEIRVDSDWHVISAKDVWYNMAGKTVKNEAVWGSGGIIVLSHDDRTGLPVFPVAGLVLPCSTDDYNKVSQDYIFVEMDQAEKDAVDYINAVAVSNAQAQAVIDAVIQADVTVAGYNSAVALSGVRPVLKTVEFSLGETIIMHDLTTGHKWELEPDGLGSVSMTQISASSEVDKAMRKARKDANKLAKKNIIDGIPATPSKNEKIDIMWALLQAELARVITP